MLYIMFNSYAFQRKLYENHFRNWHFRSCPFTVLPFSGENSKSIAFLPDIIYTTGEMQDYLTRSSL